MATSNRTTLKFKKETAVGTAIGGAADGIARFTGESVGFSQDFISSSEIRSDRARGRGVRSASRVAGDISFEFSHGWMDPLILGLCGQSAWPTGPGTFAATVDMDADGITGATGIDTDDYKVNQIVNVGGGTVAANQGFARVSSVSASEIGLERPAALTADTNPTTAITLNGQGIGGNGTTISSFTIEKTLDDAASDKFLRFVGCKVGGFSLDVSTAAIVTGSMSFLGTEASLPASAGITGGTASSTRAFNTADSHNEIWIDDAKVDRVNSVSFSIENNLREVLEIGRRGARDIALGSCAVTGSMEIFYNDADEYEKMLDGDAFRLTLILSDGTNWYAFHFPVCDFTNGEVVAEGIDTDVLARMDWEASVGGGDMFTFSRSH